MVRTGYMVLEPLVLGQTGLCQHMLLTLFGSASQRRVGMIHSVFIAALCSARKVLAGSVDGLSRFSKSDWVDRLLRRCDGR